MNIGKQAADLCSSSISQYFVAAYFDSGPWDDYVRSLIEIYRRRRDVMLDALAEHFPREAEWTHPQGGLFIWATMPDYIDTTDLLARALEQHVAFVPGRAAFVDGRGGSAMRLNFSGVERGRHPRGRSDASARSSASRSTCMEHAHRHRHRSDAAGGAADRHRPAVGGERRLRALRPARAGARVTPSWPRSCACRPSASGPDLDEPDRGAQGRPIARAPGIAEVRGSRRGRARAARPRA